MTARTSRLWSVLYNTESAWAEAASTFATRLRVLNQPTIGFTQERIQQPYAQQYSEESSPTVRGPQGGELSFEMPLTGLGSSMTGALTESDLSTLLGLFLGASDATMVSDTVATGTSATQFAATSETYDTHQLIRLGVLGDGRCEGQAVAVNNGATTTLLTAAPGTPNAADQVWAMSNIYPREGTNAGALTSLRFLVQSANGQWICRGCFPKALSFSGLAPGQQPTVSFTFGVSSWEEANVTFPNTTAAETFEATTCGGGSVFINDVGTATRVSACPVDFSLNINIETNELHSLCGASEYQTIVGATRQRVQASFDLTIDAEAAGTSTWADAWDAGTNQHVLVTLNAAAGRAIAFYFPNAEWSGNRPTQQDVDGLNRVMFSMTARTDDTFTTEQQAASFKLGLG